MRLFITRLCLLVLLCTGTAFSGFCQSASIQTEFLDYPPGSLVNITGSGFLAGETVTLQVLHFDANGDNDSSSAHRPFTTIADATGHVVATWTVPFDEDELGATLLLTAHGETSGLNAQYEFTDANVTFNASGLPAGSNVTVTYRVYTTSSGPSGSFSTINFTTPGSSSPGIAVSNSQTIQYSFSSVTSAGTTYTANPGSATGNNNGNGAQQITAQYSAACTVPTISCPPSLTLPCNATIPSGATSISAFLSLGGSTNASTSISFSDGTPATVNCIQTITRTYTVFSNICSASCSQQIQRKLDITAPTIATLPAPSTINCPTTPVFAQATATDACDPTVTLTFVDNTTPGNCPGNYSVTRVWTATDDCGNSSTASQTINVQDITAPTIATLPAPTTINCPATPVFAQATATDACDPTVTLTFVDNTTPGNCPGNYSVTRVWTATDDCGKSSTASQTINVHDITAPVINTLPATSTINCPATPVFAQATATDACDPTVTLTFVDNTTPGNCPGNYSVTRVWTATDDCGNSSTASQTINVQDVTAPTIAALPAPSTINCPATPVFAQATATDACDPTVRLTFVDNTTPGNCPGNYSVTRVWTATDNCGNSSTASQTINVQDVTAPVINSLPETSTINCPAIPMFAQATAIDACDPTVTLTFVDNTTPGNCPGNYSVTRVWTAIDDCGNSSTASQTINVQDITAPVINALPGATTLNCPATPVFAQATAIDACDPTVTLTFVDNTTPGNCPGNYSMTRVWTATDDCGNSSTASQTINVQDVTAPTIAALPATSTINCPATPVFAQATATDACDPTVALTFVDNTTPGNCPGNYSVTRVWTATDDCGNSSTASQTINVQDVTAPTIAALPAPSTINCPATPVFAQATATDACDPTVTLTFVDNTTHGNCPGNYSVTRVWTATDDCGNSSTASQTINVQDVTAPTIAALPAPSTINCPATPVFAQATATDACDPTVTLTFVDNTTHGNCPGNYSVTRVWTAKDDCGNSSTASQTINVQDVTAPTIAALPATSTINCPATPVFAQATATDACDPTVTLTFVDNTTPGNCPGNYSVTRVWTATDDCGNSSTASQTLNVQDITAPVINALPATSTINCPATPVFAQATATDACDPTVTLTFVDNTTPGNCPGNYSVTRVWTATDDCGNSSTASQTINVQDVTAPTIAALPAPTTINCPATPVFAQATATDACDPTVTLTFVDNTTPGNCPGNYSITRVWTATDDCGNSSTASQTINVQDITAPVINALPATSTINCPATPVFAQATATDACDPTVTLTFVDNTTPGNCPGNYSVTRVWTATDDCGNSSTASQTINVQDVTAPTIAALPAPSTINCPATPVFAQATATDACDPTVTLTFVDNTTPGNCPGNYSVTRVWTATDDSGNSSTASQTINVQDVTAPTIAALPAPTTINCPATPVFAQATATDACDPTVTLTFVDNTTPGNCPGNYSITRVWTATDDCGNSSTASQTINVQDVTAPTIAALPAPSTINCPATPVFAQATATDACDPTVTLTFVDNTTHGNCPGNYSVTRVWTATDDCGNSSTVSQTINVQDITAPVINALPATSTINCPATPVFAQATATDACDPTVTLTFVDNTTPGNCPGNYSVTRVWTATDDCGNSSTASQTINVQDITAPVINALPGATTINCPATPVFAQAIATDACDPTVTLTFVDNTTPGNCPGNYSVTRVWTATDDCGNSSTASQTINVQDVTAPTIATLPAPSTINCPATPVFAQAIATDACDPTVTLTFVDNTTPGNCPGNYSVTRVWTATDDCGNSSTASQTINVQDITAPVINALPGATTINCPATPVFAQATATDACDPTVTLTFVDNTTPGNCPGNYSVTRVWTATDDCGNNSTASQTINVQDITAPVINSLPATSTINCPATPVFAQATATDACDPTVTLTFVDNTTPGNCPGNYSVTRVWTATDDCGNSSTASQTINVQDIMAPTIAALPAPTTINCPATPVFAQATAIDACDPTVTLTFVDNTTPGNCPGNYSVTRVWTATDDCGNSSTASQTINVQDVTAPTIATLPTTSTINCPAMPVFAQATATDACDPTVTLTFVDNTTHGNCPGNYSITRVWTATDDCGNSSTASQTINVQDITAPVINSLPATSTINCPATPVFAQATATDACDPTVTLTFVDNTTPGNCPGNYSVTRVWTATDDCGNSSTASQTINVQDVTAPTIATLPPTSTINCPATPMFAQATATDACDPTVTLTFVDNTTPGNCPGNYSVTRVWTATDDCGNSSTASQTINVQDVTAPTIAALPAPSTINCPATPVFAQATATDACDPTVTLTFVDNTTPGNCPGNYSVTRVWKATDDCGNSSTASQTINVQDITAPVITVCPTTQVVHPNTINCTYTLPDYRSMVIASDACSGTNLSKTQSPAPGTPIPAGQTTVTIIVSDACGNNSVCTFTVTNTSTLAATCSSNNNRLYYGYAGDQTALITTTPTGGTAPYTVTYTLNRPLNCNMVTSAGDELFVGGSNTTFSNANAVCPTSGMAPGLPIVTSGQINAGGTYAISVTLMNAADVIATVKDALGCTYTCTTHISAEDVRCFAGNSGRSKVTICHKTGSASNPCVKICVDESAVAEHLAHGDFLGNCTPDCQPPLANRSGVKVSDATVSMPDPVQLEIVTELRAQAMPNPTTGYFSLVVRANNDQPVSIRVVNALGIQVSYIANIGSKASVQLGQDWKAGTYYAEIRQGSAKQILKLIKIK